MLFRSRTIFHEIGHFLDFLLGEISSKSEAFEKALYDDFKTFAKAFQKTYNIKGKDLYRSLSKFLIENQNLGADIVSDLFFALSGGKCAGKYGHEPEYWKNPRNLLAEAFAHFFAVTINTRAGGLDYIKEVFPTAYEEFLKLFKSRS